MKERDYTLAEVQFSVWLRHRFYAGNHCPRSLAGENALQQRARRPRGLGMTFMLTGLMAIGFMAFAGIQL